MLTVWGIFITYMTRFEYKIILSYSRPGLDYVLDQVSDYSHYNIIKYIEKNMCNWLNILVLYMNS